MASKILQKSTINSGYYPHFRGLKHNDLSGSADYGNKASWNTSGTDKLGHWSGEDPSESTVKWSSQSKYEGWMNTRVGFTEGRYLTGDFISGCKFSWRTYPNQDGGIALRRWGIQIVNGSTHKRWSSDEVANWSTDSSWKKITYNFSGDLLSQLNRGWRFEELHFMVHTPSIGKTPSSVSVLEIKDFEYIFKCANNTIIPAVRPYNKRDLYAIA